MTSAQVVEMSVTKNSSFQNYTHADDHTIQTIINMCFVSHLENTWDLHLGKNFDAALRYQNNKIITYKDTT